MQGLNIEHKSFNSKEEFKFECKVRSGGGYKLVQVLYVSPKVTVTVYTGSHVTYLRTKIERAIILKVNTNPANTRVSQK